MFSDTAADTLLVLSIGAFILYGMFSLIRWYQARKEQEWASEQRKRLERARRGGQEVITPQMGFPIERGVQGWQDRR